MLDTNICIYIMKKKPEKVLDRFQKEIDNGICLSSITLAEVNYHLLKKAASNTLTNGPMCFDGE